MSEAKGLEINIMGREFLVACAPGEQNALLLAVEYLNLKMQEIKDQGKVTGMDGKAWNPDAGHILATNGLIHNEVLNILGS